MKNSESRLYEAPRPLVAVYYLFVIAWTCFALLYLMARAFGSGIGDILQMVMIAGVLFFTWYFSLNIFHSIKVATDGTVHLTGVRRSLTLQPREINTVEGPYIPAGFIRFKLERERLYLLCMVTNKDLQAILKRVVEMNPNIRFKTK